MADPIVLSPTEVVVIRGWYDGLAVTEIGDRAGLHRTAVARVIRALRERGLEITARPNSWRERQARRAAAAAGADA